MDLNEALSVTAAKLGYESLRAEQRSILKAFVSRHDVFAALPTGYGKSLFWDPACAI